MRHKYGSKPIDRSKDNSSAACVNCGLIRQFVGGIPTYFIDDTVFYPKAPKCDKRLLIKIIEKAK